MKKTKNELCAELLILPDGRILAHNLTQPVAELLRELNPGCEQIASRAKHHTSPKHEFSD
jgi:hypothetical protein